VEFLAPCLFGGIFLQLIISLDDSPIILGIRIFMVLTLFLPIFASFCRKYVITNKNFYLIPTFKLSNILIKLLNFLKVKFFKVRLSDISSIRVDKSPFGAVSVDIITQNGENMPRLAFETLDGLESKIDTQIILLN